MGGYGSGRRWGKATTRNRLALDVRELHRDGLLRPGLAMDMHWNRTGEERAAIRVRTAADRVTLSYHTRSNGGDWQPMEFTVYLQWTGLHFGGRRPWFLCPAQGCGRRVAILYAGTVFTCRHCQRLVYECQRETDDGRAARRADAIRRRLGWEPGIFNGDGWKPKGMHWRTFDRLRQEHDAYVNIVQAGLIHRFRIALPDDPSGTGV